MEETSGIESKRRRRIRVACALTLLALAVLALGALVTHGSVHAARSRVFEAPTPRVTLRSFDDVLRAGTRVSLCMLQTGVVAVPRSEMLRRRHVAYDAPREHEPLPIFAHLIRHPSRGDVLVDTGLDASFVDDSMGNFRPIARAIHGVMGARFSLPRGADVRSQLARVDAHPRVAFITHVHGDHTAGIPALPRSMRIVVGAGETDDVAAYLGYGHVDSTRVIETLDFARGVSLAPFAHTVDLFGDGSLVAVSTPGHSAGHTSYFVNAASGPVLLIGDAAHTRWGFEHGVGPRGPTEDYDAIGQATLLRIREFARRYPQVTLVFGHEAATLRCDLAR